MNTSFSRKLAASAILAGLAFSLSAKAATITAGNPTTGGSHLDTCPSCDYIVSNPFSSAGYHITTYSFNAGQAGNITPELFNYSIDGGAGTVTFTLVGIGTTQAISATGVQTFNFGLVNGTNVTSANSIFGFHSTAPTVLFDYFAFTAGATPDATMGTFFDNPSLMLGGMSTSDYGTGYHVDSLGFDNNRTYAINANASNTPEPSSLALLGTGLAGIGGLVKRRFRRS